MKLRDTLKSQKKADTLYEKRSCGSILKTYAGLKQDYWTIFMIHLQKQRRKNFKIFAVLTDNGSLNPILKEMMDTNYELENCTIIPINEKVIFPNAKAESMGMEDVRFVKFEDELDCRYYGTYTAYNGHHIKTQLIETKDFSCIQNKDIIWRPSQIKAWLCFLKKSMENM